MADFSLAGFLPVAASLVGMFTSARGSNISAQGARDAAVAARVAGEAQKAASQFEAAQLDQQSGQSVAAAIQAANEQRRQAGLVQSRALALVAASGGGASDTTVMKLLARQAGEGAYRAGVALYQGEEQARKLRMAAATKRYEGDLAVQSANAKAGGYETTANAYETTAAGNFLSGAGSLFAKYGMGGPKADGTTDKAYSRPAASGDYSLIDMGV
jgi:hypothetical protein